MIKKKKAKGKWVWRAYCKVPKCSGDCSHSECATGLTRKIYIGTFDNWKEASDAVDRVGRDSKRIREAKDTLYLRMKVIGVERDKLRSLIAETVDVIASCDEALDDLRSAIDALSRYA